MLRARSSQRSIRNGARFRAGYCQGWHSGATRQARPRRVAPRRPGREFGRKGAESREDKLQWFGDGMGNPVFLADEIGGDTSRLKDGGQTAAGMRATADQIAVRKLFELVMRTHEKHLIPAVRHIKGGAQEDGM